MKPTAGEMGLGHSMVWVSCKNQSYEERASLKRNQVTEFNIFRLKCKCLGVQSDDRLRETSLVVISMRHETESE